jgi:hypothetical protein
MNDKDTSDQSEDDEQEVVGQAQTAGDPYVPDDSGFEVSESSPDEEGEDDPKVFGL